MKKIDLALNFKAIKERIERDIGDMRPSDWAKRIGVSIQIVSNIHGKKGKDSFSLEYVVAVAQATGKSIEWYLFGLSEQIPKYAVNEPVEEYLGDGIDEFSGWSENVKTACRELKEILDSEDTVASSAIQSNLKAFVESVRRGQREKSYREEIIKLKMRVDHLEKQQGDGASTGIETADDAGLNKKAM